jgi:tripartite-type tricarboxylate transporter receptor subunit TctC
MKKRLIALLITAVMVTGLISGCSKKEAANSFDGKNVRVVIGSTSTSGDSYLVAETVSRYLGKALNATTKVDAIGAAEALDAMQTSKPDGTTIMIFHDMTYLGVAFGAYGEEYALENMSVGPRVAQNPGSIWAAGANAPYENLAEIPEYLKANPDAICRIACESGGVSHVAFIVFYQWVVEKYGQDVADRIVVVVGGSTADKCQLLWDGNCDVIFADYTSIYDYTQTDDQAIAMKYMGLLDNMEGIDVPSYADLGITMSGEEFHFSKDFLIYLPKDTPQEYVDELDAAMEDVSNDETFQADLETMTYRAAYLGSNDANTFIYDKRDSLQEFISTAPSLDDLTQ